MRPIEFIRTKVLDVTQAQLAVIAMTTQPTVSRWEKGDSEPDRGELDLIRAEVISRGHSWNDRWFFEVPTEAS